MPRERLQNKPLVEALLEVQWHLEEVRLQASEGGVAAALQLPSRISEDGHPVVLLDPHSQLLPGRLSDRVENEYPQHERTPAAVLPESMAAWLVQHRFRHKDGWPIIQLGPGILTVNDTEKYKWEDFKPRCERAVRDIYHVYPKKLKLRPKSVVLRYIDAVDLDCTRHDIGGFLKDQMGLDCRLPETFFEQGAVEPLPRVFQWHVSHRCASPAGIINLLIHSGTHSGRSALIWETIFQSADKDLPELPDGIDEWLDAAHEVTDDWFFKLIQGGSGELYRRFKGDR